MVRIENAGPDNHDFNLMRLAPGVTLADLQASLNPEKARRDAPAGAPPKPLEALGTPLGGVAAIGPGGVAYLSTTLEAGEYAIVCMVTAADGRSHIEHGMIQRFTVR